ncbi:calcium-binding protein, partial [Caulobacter sp. CCNWLY153]|uniref:calcium-binding protein n=1 Tax=unclassified Caulobacter TaxID=2648921 RepID=UPI002FEE71F5
GALTTRQLLAGSGYGDDQALAISERRADGGVVQTGYDVFRDARFAINEVGAVETRTYDGMGRLVSLAHTSKSNPLTLRGTTGKDEFDIRGPSVLEGNGGADVFRFNRGVGSVVINAPGGTSSGAVLEFDIGTSLSDLAFSNDGSGNLVIINAQGDRIHVTGQFAASSNGVAQIKFADGSTLSQQQITGLVTTGSAGNRRLYGTSGANTFDSRGQAFYAQGNGGADVFIYNAGYGALEIAATGSGSILRMGPGFTAENLAISSDASGNLIIGGGANDLIQVNGQYGSTVAGIDLIEFADGTTLTRQQLAERVTIGSTLNSSLYGTSGNNYFDGKGAAHYIRGGGGTDTFVYKAGYGALQIDQQSGSTSVLVLGEGLSTSNLSFTSNTSNDLIITGANGDRIVVSNHFAAPFVGILWGVGSVQFADGTTLNRQQLASLVSTGSAANAKIYGSGGADIIDSMGFASFAQGGGGGDTFVYNLGYGELTIDNPNSAGSILQFGAGITQASLTFRSDSGDLLVTGQNGDAIRIRSHVSSSYYSIGSFMFADGTTLSREQVALITTPLSPAGTSLNGTTAAETLIATSGVRYINGQGGNDTFVYNAGHGALEITQRGGTGATLQLGAGLTLSNLVFDSIGGDLIITGPNGDRIEINDQFSSGTFYGVASVLLADGTTLNRAQLGAMVTTGSAANRTIYGADGADVIDTNGQAHYIDGRGGADTIIYNPGYGALEINQGNAANAVLRFGAGYTLSNLSFRGTSTGGMIISAANGDVIQINNQFTSGSYYGVGSIEFADGSTLTRQQMLDILSIGSAANRFLYGASGAETFDTTGAARYINGNGGADTFLYNVGYGALEIQQYQYGGSGSVLRFGAGIGMANLTFSGTTGDDLIITVGGGGRVQLNDQFYTNSATGPFSYGVDTIELADGTTISRQQMLALAATGSTANRLLYGTPGGEVFDTNGVANYIKGNGGDDTFLFNVGYGAVRIEADAGSGATSTSILQLGPGITAAQLIFTGSGSNLIIANGTGDNIVLVNQLTSARYGVSEIRFADGSILNRQQFMGLYGSTQSLIDSYTYDGLGQRIRHSNSQLGTTALAERTDYDLDGRVVSQIDFNGYATTYAYAYDASLATTGLGVFGGWTQTITNTAGLISTAKADYFGRSLGGVDFGGRTSNLTYDLAGRLVQKTNSAGQDLRYTYFNTGALASESNLNFGLTGAQSVQTYGYDAAGRRTRETQVLTTNAYDEFGQVYQVTRSLQDASMTYDALGRTTRLVDSGEDGANPVDINYEYDANNNVRLVASTYRDLVSGALVSKNQWYRYDSMNRFVTTGGQLLDAQGAVTQARGAAGNTIGRGDTGVDLTYDRAGRRISATSTGNAETYTYTPSGYLSTVHINGALRVQNVRDSMGRLLSHSEYNADGKIAYSEDSTYDAGSQVILSQTSTLQSDGAIITANTTYDYRADVGGGVYTGAYLGGMVVHTRTTSSQIKSGQTTAQPTSDTVNTYVWWDGPKQSVISIRPDITKSTVNTSTFTYDTSGNVVSVAIQDGRPRTVHYVTNAAGQILSRKETSASSANPVEYYYRFNNIQRANIGNDGANGKTNYAASIAQRSAPAQSTAFQGGSPSSYADMDQQYDALNANSLAEAEGAPTYTVVPGDTLQSIAAGLWGDASLWYLIANFNGLTGSEELVQGTRIQIPAQVTNVHHSSDTFQAYDPTQALGSVAPDQVAPVQPRKKQGCGVFGQILAVVVAAVVTYVTAGALGGPSASFLGKIVIGAASMAVGNVAQQVVGIATGVQDKFSWKSVGMAAINGAVGGAVGVGGPGNLGTQIVRGAAANVVTQGVAVATGLQSKFDWTSVAVSAVGTAVGGGVARAAGGTSWAPAGSIRNMALAGTAELLASAGAQSLLTGTDFGDNVRSMLPSVVGSTIGRAITNGMATKPQSAHDGRNKAGSKEPAYGNVQVWNDTVSVEEPAPLQAWRPDDPGPLSTMPTFRTTPSGAITKVSRRGRIEIGDATFIPASRYSTSFAYKQTVGQFGSLTMQGPAGADLHPTYGEIEAGDGRKYSTLTVTDTNTGDVYYQGGYFEGLEVTGEMFSLSVSKRDQALTRAGLRSSAYADGLTERANAFTDAVDSWVLDPVGVTGEMLKATWEGGRAISRLMNPLNFKGRIEFTLAVGGQIEKGVTQIQTAQQQGNLDLLVANRLGYYTPDIVMSAVTGGEAAVARFGAAAPVLRGGPLVLDNIGFDTASLGRDRLLGGLSRGTEALSQAEIQSARKYAATLGLPDEKLQFFTGVAAHQRSAYSDLFDTVFVGPDLNPGIGPGLSANSRISPNGLLAHEIVGHRETSLAGRAFEAGSLHDEVQASWRAARLAPGLTPKDRTLLLRDAVERIHASGLRVRDVDKSQYWFGR